MAEATIEGATETRAGPMLAADGTPLRASLARSLRRQKWRAFLLVLPLLAFVVVFFAAPIVDMLFRSVENGIVRDTLPRTIAALSADPDPVPGEEVFAALHLDLVVAEERKRHTQLGTRLNYEIGGASSLFRGTGRAIGDFGEDLARDLAAIDPRLTETAAWVGWFGDDATRAALPRTAAAWDAWLSLLPPPDADGTPPDPVAELDEDVAPMVLTGLARDLAAGAEPPAAMGLPPGPWPAAPSVTTWFTDEDEGWGEPEIWSALRLFSPPYTPGYYLSALDLQQTEDGIAPRDEDERIYRMLFLRTLVMSLAITGLCIVLAYPVAFLLAHLPARRANLLMILVLLPFWTSLLVRTSAWKVLLQQQGVINDILVWAGLVSDSGRLMMINNQTGTIIAMTHILLPFMILPLYSVMKGIPPAYVRAARSLGANDWTAFWRVYFPQSVPGIGAGSILVFILAIGYYITPELVGGTKGVFISNRIAYHISDSLNWGLAAALGTILLVAVLALYWAYDRLVGIDNVRLGG